MITKLSIKNFKSFEHVEIPCSNLNVLTGLNGMGKSSVLQSLLLLRQSFMHNSLEELDSTLTLNGDLIELGTVKDIFYEFASEDEITFAIESDDEPSKEWRFSTVVRNPDTSEILTSYMNSDYMPFEQELVIPENLSFISLFKNDKFKYLNADRWVKNEYDMSDLNVTKNRSLGVHGEFTAHYLEKYGGNEINPQFLYPGSKTNALLHQVSEWMKEISPGIKIIAERIPGLNSVKLRYRFEENKMSTNEITPLNIGFGITYILSVLVALLSSKKDDLLIIENPESHIHPKGQSIIGKILAVVAASGTQVFVETHSDHLINGILISILNNNKNPSSGINSDKTKINFIRRMGDSFASENLSITILENGRLRGIPEDFFDQYSKDMKTILGF